LGPACVHGPWKKQNNDLFSSRPKKRFSLLSLFILIETMEVYKMLKRKKRNLTASEIVLCAGSSHLSGLHLSLKCHVAGLTQMGPVLGHFIRMKN
jgi:hypothetical protein